MQWDKLRPKYMKEFGQGKRLNPGTTINIDVPIIKTVVEEAVARFNVYEDNNKQEQYKNITFIRGMDTETVNRINEIHGNVYVENDEGYFIDSTGDDIIIRSASERGLFYGAQAISVMLENSGNIIPSLVAYEYPICPERGVKCYIPAMNHIAYFKKFVDMMCRYKNNTLLLEIGGAMEYKRHPEINVEWVKFCDDIREYSGKSTMTQEATYSWRKNSMHVENGDGGFVSQDVVRDLVEYCKERYIEVIPEVLSLSHCDYICRAYPEIAERTNDPYPDTYCPSHPKSYRILFDILDEIIDVFEPNIVHVGHDEYYSYGKCPRCKGKDPAQIFTDDVNKIYNHLHSRGLKTMMWAEKFLNAYHNGKAAGGADKPPAPAYENKDILCEGMAATYAAIDKVPRDIKMLHWYWGLDPQLEKEFHKRNMPTTYGNYAGTQHTNFKERIKAGALGGLCSNWSTLSELIMQWNGVIFETAYNSMTFWDPDYDFHKRDETLETVAKDLYQWNNMDALNNKNNYEISNAPGGYTGNYIRVKHTTTRDMPFEIIADGVFLDRNKYHLGDYVVVCENGREARIPLHFGENIASIKDSFTREADQEDGADGNVISSVYKLKSVSYQALPFTKDGGTWYDAILSVPDSVRGLVIKEVKFEKTASDCDVMVEGIEIL
ncbi:MAG: beta-N-acetylhexosaminidase [Defluviitaleaceae bacterium]|nr:beta-N-acetylhexosaminidase [Defluviitaleaceae bacterium]